MEGELPPRAGPIRWDPSGTGWGVNRLNYYTITTEKVLTPEGEDITLTATPNYALTTMSIESVLAATSNRAELAGFSARPLIISLFTIANVSTRVVTIGGVKGAAGLMSANGMLLGEAGVNAAVASWGGVFAAGYVGYEFAGPVIDSGLTWVLGKSLGEVAYPLVHPEDDQPAFDPLRHH